MTQQEQQLLSGLIDRVNKTEVNNKDEDAERTLQSGLDSNPNALYILSQTVLVQQFALNNAQQQLQAARTELDKVRSAQPEEKHGSFLGNLFGLNKDDDTQPRSNMPATQPGYRPVQNPGPPAPPAGYGPGYGAPQPPYGAPAPGYGAPMGGGIFGGGGGFLQGAAQTAAGVMAGEFAFNAIEDMMHGFGGHERGFGDTGTTEVVNNYYDDNRGDNGSSFGDRLAAADGNSGGISSDIEDRRGDSQGFFGGDGGDSSSFTDDGASSDYDSGSDDSGSSDDGGNFDNGGNDDSGF